MSASFGALALVGSAPTAIEYVANEVRFKGLGLASSQVADVAAKLKPLGYAVRSEGNSVFIKPEANP